jgi:hypothetical protein
VPFDSDEAYQRRQDLVIAGVASAAESCPAISPCRVERFSNLIARIVGITITLLVLCVASVSADDIVQPAKERYAMNWIHAA